MKFKLTPAFFSLAWISTNAFAYLAVSSNEAVAERVFSYTGKRIPQNSLAQAGVQDMQAASDDTGGSICDSCPLVGNCSECQFGG